MLCATPAVAAEAGADVIVTASRTSELAAEGGTVVTRADLDALQPATALEALSRVAGVRAFQTGGAGGGSYLLTRGGEPNFTLVLLDGARVNDPTGPAGGAFDFTQIDPALIDRIEVFRGSVSAVQGADALAGVVNLRLRDLVAGRLGGSARVSGSTYGEVGGDLSLNAGWQGGGVLVGGGGYDSGGLTRGSGLARGQGIGRLVQEAGGIRLAVTGLYAATSRTRFPEDSGGPELAVIRAQQRTKTELGLISGTLSRSEAGAALQPVLRLAWSGQTADDRTPAIAPGALQGVPAITSRTGFDRIEGAGELRWRRGILTVVGGGGAIAETGRLNGIIDFGFPLPQRYRLQRTIPYAFAEASLDGGRWRLTAGARYDAPSTADARWSSRLSGALQPLAGGPELQLSYSDGFKLPSFYALAYPVIANPLLRPETARSWEAAAVQRIGRTARLRVAAFRTDYRDLIDFDPVRFTNVNRARARAEGIEAEARVELGAVSMTAAFTYLDVTNPGGPALRDRPDVSGSARVDWRVRKNVALFAAVDGVGSFFDLSVPTGQVRVGGRTTFDLGASVVLPQGLRLDLVARNLTDERYQDSIGFPAPAAGLRAQLSARF
ncbi:MAG: TonB-dependent receptor [Sphingomonadaceae bacterium]|nr:TonB-dependent receptor [Sphingomonadaceae bacterium]